MFPFLDETDPALRHQILTYYVSATMTDRERAALLGLPKGCRIREGAKILSPEKFVCGEDVYIGEGAILDAQGGLTVGRATQIGVNVMVWTHSSHWQALRGQTGVTRDSILYRPTRIGESCFIAGPSVVVAGVTIGNRVLVPPFSLVEEDVPDGTVLNTTGGTVRDLKARVAQLERQVEDLGTRLGGRT